MFHNGLKVLYGKIALGDVRFVDTGTLIRLCPTTGDDKITLLSKIEISKLVSTTDEGLPVVHAFTMEGESVHKGSEFVKVFSGDYMEPNQSVAVHIKARVL